MPHPAVQILVWITLAFLAQTLHATLLIAMTSVLLVAAARLNPQQLFGLIRRTRWILFSLLLIYSYTTPGVALIAELGRYSPTVEGLSDGLMQLGRLLVMLSALAILLSLLSESQFISGIYTLAYPLNWIGGSRERVAVRLALTLRYAEPAMRDTAADWRATIRDAMQSPQGSGQHVMLDRMPLRAVDGLCLLFCAALLYGAWK